MSQNTYIDCQMSLLSDVRSDIENYLLAKHEVLFNERDLQMHLAFYLMHQSTHHYDDVDLEYYVPRKTGDEYNWDSELRIDIVVRKGEEFVPVELKYKTKSVTVPLHRFGGIETYNCVLKNQGAQDLGCYDFWKDVRRIEYVRNRFHNVAAGLAVFVSNDPFYWNNSIRESSAYRNFNISDGIHSKQKKWSKEVSISKGRPDFSVECDYSIQWKPEKCDDYGFRFFILSVD